MTLIRSNEEKNIYCMFIKFPIMEFESQITIKMKVVSIFHEQNIQRSTVKNLLIGKHKEAYEYH